MALLRSSNSTSGIRESTRRCFAGEVGTFPVNTSFRAVGSKCTGLLSGYYVCVGVPGTPTEPPEATNTAPGPTQTGITPDCKEHPFPCSLCS